MTGRPSEDVEPRLRALVAKEVLDEDVDPRSAERGQFRFVQSVIQEVAYSTLSKAARRAKHMACATWLAGLDEDDLAGIVASHFLEAYRAEPAVGLEEVARHDAGEIVLVPRARWRRPCAWPAGPPCSASSRRLPG